MSENPAVSAPAHDLLDRARAGDAAAFAELTAPHRRELHVHCYRMLGSLADAEDALQETLLAAWRGLADFAGRSSLRVWLYRIATTRCLNVIRAHRRRIPHESVPPFDPPAPTGRDPVTWLQPYPDAWLAELVDDAAGPAARLDARESIRLEFVGLLQRLPARQAAALVLSDVLGFTVAEVAAMTGTTGAAVKGALQRARARLRQDQARQDQADGRPDPADDAGPGTVAARFAAAYIDDDIDALVALLTDDAWLRMPPATHLYLGRSAIGEFLRSARGWRGARRTALVPTGANGQPAFGWYVGEPGASPAYPSGLVVLGIRDGRIGSITRFHDPGLVACFELPPHA